MDFCTRVRESLDGMVAMFGQNCVYEGMHISSILSSGQDVNVVLGFTEGLRGSLVIGLTRKAALGLASIMMGCEIVALDNISRSAISEFGNMLMGSILNSLPLSAPVNISSPTLVAGRDVYLVISRVESHVLRFTLGAEPISVSFSLE